jgi:DNA-binding NarL/FixJ family response regulator
MKKSIVIVDDHVLIAQALKGIIANFPDFEVWYECENGKDLQHQLASKNKVPDVVLMDISMPEMNGFEATLWLKEHYPNVLVLALSMQDDDESVIKMVKNGAKGYLLKNSHPTELEKALKAITTIGFYYPDWAASKVFASLGIAEVIKKTKSALTDREKEFLRYTVTEMSYKEIAEKMFCSPRTVESYRDSLFEKLEIKTRVGLAVYAMKNGYDTL